MKPCHVAIIESMLEEKRRELSKKTKDLLNEIQLKHPEVLDSDNFAVNVMNSRDLEMLNTVFAWKIAETELWQICRTLEAFRAEYQNTKEDK